MVVSDLSGQQIKGYVLREQLGSGGFGAVYRAYQEDVQREVAIKIILPRYANQPEFIRRFEAEAQTIAQLEHPYIVPMHDYWRDPHGAYLVMRLLRGGSIRDVLRQHHMFDVERIAVLLGHIASALHHAHQQQVIHRDIKPDNILLDENGIAYLADFGIAKNLSQETNGTRKEIVGSLDYLSPEQARSEPITARTDIYSMGVVLYELLVGEHPFYEVSSVERMYKHISDPLPEITSLEPDLNQAVNEIIQRATQKNPKERYPDVLSLAREFAEVAQMTVSSSKSIYETLTSRELDILRLVAEELTNQEIAEKLVVEHSTIRWYIRQINKKLRVFSREELKRKVAELGWFDEETSTIDASSSQIALLWDDVENPYKGLRAFERGEAQDFFGREEFVERLLWRMQEADPYQRFLAIVGPSGSGKSSVARAGLLPALVKNAIAGSDHWFCIDMIPGDSPFDALETALIRIAADQAMNLHDQISRDERGLVRAADLILPKDKSELLLLIDQFEEVFTLVTDEGKRQRFLDLLLATVTAPHSRVRIVVTLRADFYDRPLHYPKFGEILRTRMETILPLTAQGIERAIVGPVERMGMVFEDGLVAHMVSQTTYQAGALPLLQFALTALFDLREGHKLTHDAYQQIGGVGGALANRVEDIYSQLDAQAQEAVRQLFLRLVTLGEGVEDTRRRVPRSELVAVSNDADLMEDLIDYLAQERFLALDNDPATRAPMVEVAHEAILREWERLRGWIDKSRTELRLHRQLIGWVSDWQHADQESSYLLRGARLEQFEDWSKTTTVALTPTEKHFLEKSTQARIEFEAGENARQQRENELEKRSQKRTRYLNGALIVLLISAILFSFFALDREQKTRDALSMAEREADINQSLVFSNDAIEAYQRGETDLALLIALEAVDLDDPPQESIRALGEVARGIGTRAILKGHTNEVRAIAISQDNHFVASGSCANLVGDTCQEGAVILWDLRQATDIWQLNDSLHDGWITGLDFSPTGDYLVVSSDDGTVAMWDVETGELVHEFIGHEGAVNAVDYHPTEAQILTAGDDGIILLWDVATGNIIHRFTEHSGAVNDVVFNQDGTEILSGSEDKLVILWNTQTGEPIITYEQSASTAIGIHAVAFDPAHSWVLGSNTQIVTWDKETAEFVHVEGTSLRLAGLAVGADGTTYDGSGRFVRLVNSLIDGTNVSERLLYDHDGLISMVTVSLDNQILLTGATDGAIRIWNINAQLVRRIEIPASTSRLRLSPDQDSLLIGSFFENAAFIYDLRNGLIEQQIDGEFPLSWAIEYSPDGRYAAIGYINFFDNDVDTTLILVDLASGEIVRNFVGHTIRVSDISFSPDGRYLLSSSQNFAFEGELFLWDVTSGELVRTFENEGNIANVDITNDGQFVMSTSYFSQYIAIWDMNTGKLLRRRDFETNIEYSRLGITDHTALIGLDDGRLLEVDMETLETLRTFNGHTGTVWDIALSADGSLMASGQGNGLAILWDYETGRELERISYLGGGLMNVAFGPNDSTIFTSAYLGEVLEWYVSNQSLDELIGWIRDNRHLREFTCEERDIYRIEPLCESETSEESAQQT